MRHFYTGLTTSWGRPFKENGRWYDASGRLIRNPKNYFNALRERVNSYMAENRRVYTYSEFLSATQGSLVA